MSDSQTSSQPPRARCGAIHQFHSGSAYGDAVTNSMLLTQGLLRQLGYRSEIYVEHVAPELASQLRPYRSYQPQPGDALLVHHSMGHDLEDWLLKLPVTRILVYHNITPSHFFAPESPLRAYAEKGRRQLETLRRAVAASICVSAYNAAELEALGYENIHVVPLLFDPERMLRAPWNAALAAEQARRFTVLFVGRVSEHKGIDDVIRAFAAFSRMHEREAQLVLVGGYDPDSPYYLRLQELVGALGLEGRVLFTGKVPTADLYGWYRAARAFVCMSDHEGFGVPLIEAMVFGVPVLAYASSSIPGTLSGAGILLEKKDPAMVAGLLQVLAEDRPLRTAVLETQRARVQDFSEARLLSELSLALGDAGISAERPLPPRRAEAPGPRWQLEGPFETSYSLALVNREVARALERAMPGEVALHATEGPGDYVPRPEDLAKVPDLEPLWRRGGPAARPPVLLRNLYPPRVADADGQCNLLYFAWEESQVPARWVEDFNDALDGIAVPSEFVRKALIDSGTRVPVRVVPHGVEHILREQRQRYAGDLGSGFRFLHVSSAFPRKGADVLLRAYGQAFSAADDVTLVLKVFPNPHNDVPEQLARLRAARADFPRVVLINEDLPAGMMLDLYQRANAFVAPTRGEGFGLPMAEAMLLGVPVITTSWGGQADFCTPETAWLVGCKPARSGSHIGQLGSLWLEPDEASLVQQLREVRGASKAQLERRVRAAKAVASEQLTWTRCAEGLRDFAEQLQARPPLARPSLRLGWVSSWNAKCGIATYSQFLIERLPPSVETTVFASRKDTPLGPDGTNVVRCWDDYNVPHLEDLEAELLRRPLDAVVIQFNFGFFPVAALGRLLTQLHRRGVRTVVTFHSTKDVDKPDFKASLRTIREELALADRLLVHGEPDLQFLYGLGLHKNSTLFPHGMLPISGRTVSQARTELGLPAQGPVLATYGFLLPHKGLEQLLGAMPALVKRFPDLRLLMVNALYPVAESSVLERRCEELVAQLGLEERVVRVHDFLPDAQSLRLLECADAVVFPYQQTAEGASGAVRFGLSAGRPVVCTPNEIFHDVSEVVHRLPGWTSEAMAEGLARVLTDDAERERKLELQTRWVQANAWGVLARRLAHMVEGLCLDAPARAGENLAA
ncbi:MULTISPECIES: glycosyltransferase [Myxococcaceae]|uniref:glycosyltransferase n=1 Tax=Myxococcaceae TaxID=31 RepID=UPI00188F5E50|nr:MULTISPECIES: glycosyltransferase [Myxococcaceae]MBF5045582.1 glycosyltransferase [Simulacricoccus sp. 17bor-14]